VSIVFGRRSHGKEWPSQSSVQRRAVVRPRISFKLGLRAQEMALLRIREVAALSTEFACGYKIKDVLVLPKSFTKGARATAAIGNKIYERTSVRFSVAEFDRLVKRIAKDARRKKSLDATDYYPAMKKSGGQTRELPLADSALLEWRRFLGIWMNA